MKINTGTITELNLDQCHVIIGVVARHLCGIDYESLTRAEKHIADSLTEFGVFEADSDS